MNTMSTSRNKNLSLSTFQSIFDAASKEYEKKTGRDLRTHPLAAEFDHCYSPDAVLDIFQKQTDALDQAGKSGQTLVKWLNPTVHLLYILSTTIAEVVGLTFSPAKVIFTGINVLLRVAKDVAASRGVLIDLFERMQSFLSRLNIYSGIPPTMEMTTMLGKIMAEILTILALSTKEMQERRIKKFGKRLAGRTDLADALERLDKLTQEETRTTVARNLEMAHGIKNATETLKRNQCREHLQSWLSPPNPSINHNIACGSHHDTTGAWFVHGSLFNEWKSSGSLLWVHGKPGCGKSILASAMIEDVKAMCDRGSGTFAYFYFDFKDSSKRDIRSLLSSILVQLCDKSDESWDVLSHLHTTHRNGSDQPSETALTQCLQDMLNLEGQQPTFIIVDAVDECPNTPGIPSAREKVLHVVEDLVKSHPDLRICVTSRPEQDIRMVLEPLTSRHISLHDQAGQKDDIVNYVRFIVRSDRALRRWRPEDQELVIDTLIQRADGMFRWVFCQLETLRRCFPSSIRQILDELPTTLDGTYEQTLLGIPEEKWKHAHRLLQCLAVSSRPLRVEELGEILSIQFDSRTTQSTLGLISGWRPENTEDAVLSACSSLIAIVEVKGSPVVQFSHFSVKEFLISNRLATSQTRNLSRYHIALERAHEILVKACLSTLLELDEHIDRKGLKDYPLAFYAAQYWSEHARFGDVSFSIQDMMGQLFDAGKPHFSAWIWIYDLADSFRCLLMTAPTERPSEPLATPLYYSAACGLRDLTEQLIFLHPDHVNPQEVHISAPLCAAMDKGYIDIARLLLQHGANVNYDRRLGWGNWSFLHQASCNGSNEVIQLLLEHGADVNCLDIDGQSPLQLALVQGHVGAIPLLLEYGANINHRDSEFGWTPLIHAVRTGHVEALRSLLQNDADVHCKDRSGKTALHWALSDKNVGAIQLLLEHGAELQPDKSVDGSTPLIQAVQKGHIDTVRLFLQHNANVEATDSEGVRALHWALCDGNLEMVRALLDRGADVYARDVFDRTPLKIALQFGYEDIVQLLLDYGAEEILLTIMSTP